MTCLACGKAVKFEIIATEVSGERIHVVAKCPECGTIFSGDIEIPQCS